MTTILGLDLVLGQEYEISYKHISHTRESKDVRVMVGTFIGINQMLNSSDKFLNFKPTPDSPEYKKYKSVYIFLIKEIQSIKPYLIISSDKEKLRILRSQLIALSI